jgi:hypothetical protein
VRIRTSRGCSRDLLVEATAWEKVGRSADVVEPYPAPFPLLDF